MASVNSVLVLNDKILETVEISGDNIPEVLNGEKGFHIYHVRMLAELILKELNRVSDKYSLSDEDIKSIAIASSLHDIGKSKIPESILNFPGKLAPLEYDIIKKHTILGCEMLEEISSSVDEKIINHAKDIARYHHERIDGTGYPYGLKGEDIPISARVVSIADSFDALTSARSYKDAFSQDVALEMIANGMSGVFDDVLVECLINVVNDNELVEIRDRLAKHNRIIAGAYGVAAKRILITGNTGYITEKFIDDAFENINVIVAGPTHLKTKGKIKVYNSKRVPYEKLFETYDFDVVIFLSRELSYNSKAEPDTEKLREILGYVARYQKEAKVVYFSSLDGAYSNKKDQSVLTLSKENLCEFYTRHYDVDIKIVRIPHLYSGRLEGDFLNKLFDGMEKGAINLKEAENAGAYFISMQDISVLMSRFLENWHEGIGTLNVSDEFDITFGDIIKGLKKYRPDLKVEFLGEDEGNHLNIKNTAVRTEYGWFSKISILDDIEEEYGNYLRDRTVTAEDFLSRLKKWTKDHNPVVKALEIAFMFIITELLNLLTGSSVMFSVVDFRMAFIVIVAIIQGLNSGLIAAGLSSAAWFVSKIISGTGWLTIFYEPSNWFAFVYYFLVGAVTGYVRLTKDDKIKHANEQNELLEEKLEFTRELYQDTFNEKRDLKKQIISSKDSFGKIFDVTRNLDTVEPHKLYLKIMDTFEDTLENKCITVYSVNNKSNFGRLEVSSRDIFDDVSRSISLDTFKPVLEKVEKDEIWRNTDFIPNLPMYASGVFRHGELVLLIFIWQARPEQNSLYYVNLFRILCDLAEISLLRAHDYNEQIIDSQYIKGTRILIKEEFDKVYSNFKDMAERKVFTYEFIEIDTKGHSYDELDDMLSGKVRANDIVGELGDGKIGILLSQALKDDLKFILPRFDGLDISVTVR